MSFISDLLEVPMEIANDLFKRGLLPVIIIGLIIAIIYYVFIM